jgi:excisionase family DNA binding protein
MPRTKIKTNRRPRNGSVTGAGPLTGKPTQVASGLAPTQPNEILTLAEAATYLRVSEQDLVRLVRKQGLPGRQVGDDWRFLRAAIDGWLSAPTAFNQGRFWQTHFGALKGDPYLSDIVREAYRRRGGPDDGDL